ncbi:lysozyme inhibitor LprI family protein [Sinorhizobium prairiense]|uniref:lysozyme inhibitor LprI family protein n=1 Tax=unclassified Sinorhizobium TaxID=2613772 RepID=UPI0023D7DAE4|nr:MULTISPECIES: lysozyme inhibitor LprI family protein [unclassified Sinorhizobium]WEJ12949.1 lysozyme inhibitor LprI family protein [Sinorhizobium sp. M103]WEJ18035.1 lysozyme inhibitor LprI family protein [Sinorhizobium sp. K101]WEJ40017.1 lysozyme inhibitor LprI family protein [Sinorhizobium sp. C101]
MRILLISAVMLISSFGTVAVAAEGDQAFAAADKELNSTFKEIEARIGDDASTKKLLVSAQKSWISFRDNECAFQTSASADGSAYPMLVAACKTALTTDRTKTLKAYLNCQEGDLSCPVPSGQ